MNDRTETHVVSRGDGKLAVQVTYTPRTGRPIRMHRLKMVVTSVEGKWDRTETPLQKEVFVYRRSATSTMSDGSARDEFICVADELDEDEIPVNEPDLERNIPYYRTADMELLFRNSDLMYETARSLLTTLSTKEK